MIDLRQLEALRAVHGAGSVTGAARQLGWSQPTVDYHLKNLERQVGAPVLSRSTRGSTLTPVGILLLERGGEILTLSERALHDARDLSQMGRTRLRFSTFPTAAAKLLPATVAQMHDLGIELDVEIAELSPLVDHLNRGEVDAALIYSVPGHEPPLRPQIATSEVHRDPVVLALPDGHPLASEAPIEIAELLTLRDERWILGTVEDPVDSLLVGTFAAAGHTLDTPIRTDDSQVMLGMVAARMGVGAVPRLASGPGHPGVVLRPVDDPLFVRALLLAAPGEQAAGRPTAAVRNLRAAIRNAVAGLR